VTTWLDSFLVDHALLRTVWNNFAVVVPGRLYRAGHPTPRQLRLYAQRHGIKTVISLRGPCMSGSRHLSLAAAERLGLHHIDAGLGSRHAPTFEDVFGLLDIFERMRAPTLMHCKSGVDRTGFAAGLYLLLNGASTREALAQLSIRFGHLATSRAGVLDAFFLRYAAEAEGRKPFLDWFKQDYDPDELNREFSAAGLASFVNDRVLLRE
jgi:protein tyrosine/serine phosphatase